MRDVAISLAIAGLGSLATYCIAVASRRIRDWQLRRKFPVAGRFLTEYGDEIEGVEVMQKATSTLEQHGREVTGKTVDLDGDRGWLLKGTIETGGFLHGFYRAEDPNDPGKGTFFLKIEGSHADMQGLWAGFDPMSSGIEGGRYEFKRIPKSTIQVAADADAASVCALLGDALGELYVDLDDVRATIDPDNPNATCLVAADAEGRLIGALTAAVLPRGSIAEVLPIGQAGAVDEISSLRFHERLCVIRSIAVVPGWRGRGIGSQLVREGLDWCDERGATAAVSFGWKSSGGCHIAGVMATTGFESTLEIPNFWTDDSRRKGYSCPECGSVCECTAVVFRRPVMVQVASRLATA